MPKLKSVLHVMYSLERSGMETMLLSSAAEWQRHGLRCDVLATAASPGPLAGALREAGYGVHHVAGHAGGRALSVASWWSFYELVRDYDVLHVHVESLATMYAVVARVAGVRCVARSIHNTFLFDRFLRLRKRLSRALCRAMGVRFGMVSDSVARCELERFANKGVRTWNWLDVEYFRPPSTAEREAARVELGCCEDRLALVSVANCNAAKNHGALLRGLALFGGVALRYFHVGLEQVGEPERKLAQELGLGDAVRFESSQTDPRKYFWACDVFVMPSLYEGLGVAALEAIASGCSALLSDTPGLCEVLDAAPHAVRMGTSPEAIALKLEQVAALTQEERVRGAITDSAVIRDMFSPQRGVAVMVTGLYEDVGVSR